MKARTLLGVVGYLLSPLAPLLLLSALVPTMLCGNYHYSLLHTNFVHKRDQSAHCKFIGTAYAANTTVR